jgi:PAS domain-containing protein
VSNDADELAARLARMNKLVVDFEQVWGDRGRVTYSATRAAGGEWPPLDGWRRSEVLLQAAIDLVGLATYAWDPKTNQLRWDARLKALWGLPRDAAVDYGVFMAGVHPEDRPIVEAAIKQCVNPDGDGVYSVEYRVIGIRDAVERRVATRGCTRFMNREPVDFVGVALDVT